MGIVKNKKNNNKGFAKKKGSPAMKTKLYTENKIDKKNLETTVCVHNIPFGMPYSKLKAIYSKYGEVEAISMIPKKTTFNIYSNKIKLVNATLRFKTKESADAACSSDEALTLGQLSWKIRASKNKNSIVINNVPESITRDDIIKGLKKFGAITQFYLKKSRQAFIYFTQAGEARKALDAGEVVINGHNLKIISPEVNKMNMKNLSSEKDSSKDESTMMDSGDNDDDSEENSEDEIPNGKMRPFAGTSKLKL